MCTAITYTANKHYFGRTLDLECSYGEGILIVPRQFPLSFRCAEAIKSHPAIIGMGIVAEGYPLFYDATNEEGLSMAGLNFPDNADYKPPKEGAYNVAPFEFIPWVLSRCSSVAEARRLLQHVNLVNIPFSEQWPLSPLHWILADREGSVTVETVRDGVRIYDNPVGVLTNEPPFDFHMTNLCHYLNLTREVPVNRFSDRVSLIPYSRGMGAFGLPGDLSSASRFVRAAFVKLNAAADETVRDVSQFFHILGAVEQPRGCVVLEDGSLEMTVYTSCCDTEKGIYYYTTYQNRRINGVDLRKEDLGSAELITYPLIKEEQIGMQN